LKSRPPQAPIHATAQIGLITARIIAYLNNHSLHYLHFLLS